LYDSIRTILEREAVLQAMPVTYQGEIKLRVDTGLHELIAATGFQVDATASDRTNVLFRSCDTVCLWQRWVEPMLAGILGTINADGFEPLQIFGEDTSIVDELANRLHGLAKLTIKKSADS
jgi:hypothetical protein